MNKYFFISYSRQDKNAVDFLKTELSKRDYRYWIDTKNIKAGQYWTEEITEAIINSGAIIFLGSKDAFTSYNIRRELLLACDENKVIIPIILGRANLPKWARFPLSGIQYKRVAKKHFSNELNGILNYISEVVAVNEFKKESKLVEKTREYPEIGIRLSVYWRSKLIGAFSYPKSQENIIIGRKSDCDIPLPKLVFSSGKYNFHDALKFRYISRTHVNINRMENEYYLIDLSTNGTILNEKTVNDVIKLQSGDSIKILSFNIIVEVSE